VPQPSGEVTFFRLKAIKGLKKWYFLHFGTIKKSKLGKKKTNSQKSAYVYK
jgi:hypothetical protein